MGLIDIFRRRAKTKSGPGVSGIPYSGSFNYFDLDGSGILSAIAAGYKFNDRDFEEFLRNGFGRNPHVFSVVSYISRTYAELPRLWSDDKDGEGEDFQMTREIEEVNRILYRPSWKYSQSDFLQAAAMQLLITGNCIMYPQYAVGFDRPTSFFIAPTDEVTIQTDNGNYSGRPIQYDINERGSFAASEVLHVRLPNPIDDTYWGLSPLFAGQAVYEASNNNFQAQASIHKNRGSSGVLSPKNSDMPLMDSEQKQLQRTWNQRNNGSEKFGGVHVTTQAMEYTPIGLNATDLRLIEHDLEALRNVCRIYGVPSVLFNDPANSTYDNMKTATKAFYNNAILPLVKTLDAQISGYLLDMYGVSDVYWCLDKKSIPVLSEPKTDLSKKLIAEVQAGILPASAALSILYPEFSTQTDQDETE